MTIRLKQWICYGAMLAMVSYMLVSPTTLWAASLWDAYRQAQDHDPVFREARASWLAEQAGLRAQHAVFWPQLSASALIARKLSTATGQSKKTINTHQYQVDISQKLFDLSQLARTKQLSYQVKQQAALYAAEMQDLMVRTAQAYFAVLTASSNRYYLQAEKKALEQQLHQVNQRHKVGLEAITAVNEVKASYDRVIAGEISAYNELLNRLEQLKGIVGKDYSNFFGLAEQSKSLKLSTDKHLTYWNSYSRAHNNRLLASFDAVLAAKEAIRHKKALYYPIVSLEGQYVDYTDTSFLEQKNMQVGVATQWKLWDGGERSAYTEQARQHYQQANEQWRRLLRQVEAEVYKSYLGIRLGDKLLFADRQVLLSQLALLKSTKEGYKVGTRTMVDVLDAQRNLYRARQQLMVDRYHYLLNTLQLKQVSGRLRDHDLHRLSQLLSKKIVIQIDRDRL